MPKVVLVIEDREIEFEIDHEGDYPFEIDGELHFLMAVQLHSNGKGFSFQESDTSRQSYWWEAEKKPLYICRACGCLHDRSYDPDYSSRMEKEHLCFICTVWAIYAEEENPMVIDGHRYTVGNESSSVFRGFGGRRFEIQYFTGEKIVTTNLWHQGEVPAYFRERIPDTARFMQS